MVADVALISPRAPPITRAVLHRCTSVAGMDVSVTADTGSLYFNSAKLSGLNGSPKATFTFATGGPEIDLVGVKKTPKTLNVDPSAPNGVVVE